MSGWRRYRTFLEGVEPSLFGCFWLHRGLYFTAGYRAACPIYAFSTRRFRCSLDQGSYARRHCVEETEAAIAAIDEQIAPVVGDDLIATTARVGHLSVLALDRNTGGTDNIGYISAIMNQLTVKTCGEWAEILTGALVTPMGASITFEVKPIGPRSDFRFRSMWRAIKT